jgi:hypothetical protein
LLTTVTGLALGSTVRAADDPHGIPLAEVIELEPGRTCLDEKRLEARVREWLGSDRVDARLHVVVTGSSERSNVVEFRITRGEDTSVRRFDPTPSGCDETHAAVGLAVAFAIDASLLTRAPRDPPSTPPLRRFVAQFGLGYEVLPTTSFGGRVGLEHGIFDWLSGLLALGVQYSPSNEVAGTRGTFDATLFSAALQACAGGELANEVRLAFCAGAAGGPLRAVGSADAASASATGAWGGAQAGLHLDLELGLRWVLDTELAVPLWSPTFRVDRAGQNLDRTPKSLGLLIHFGPAFTF